MTEKPLIIISSRTGNTLAVGHAVCDALPGAVMMRPSEVPDDLTPYNPVLLGFWCDRGDAPEEILRIAPRLRNKTIGCFATMGGDPEGEKSKAWMQKTSEKLVAMGEGNTLAETFLCRGRIAARRLVVVEQAGHPHHLVARGGDRVFQFLIRDRGGQSDGSTLALQVGLKGVALRFCAGGNADVGEQVIALAALADGHVGHAAAADH